MNPPALPTIRNQDAGRDRPESGPPIHPMSALLLVVIDNLWNLADWAALLWVVTIPLSFFSVFIPTLFIQRFVRKDSGGKAFAIALFLGVLAAVPTSISGTPVGLAILAWAGLNRLRHKN